MWFARLLKAKRGKIFYSLKKTIIPLLGPDKFCVNRLVLEIGCLTGCSTLHFAEALKDIPGSEVMTSFPTSFLLFLLSLTNIQNSQITSLDLPGKHSDFANACFQKYAPRPDPKITLIEGRAIDSLQKLVGRQFDFILFDADKQNFPAYLDTIMDKDLLAPGGMMVVDNVIRYGLVHPIGPDGQKQLYGEEVTFKTDLPDKLNNKIAGDPRLENIILPVFDGLSIVRRKC